MGGERAQLLHQRIGGLHVVRGVQKRHVGVLGKVVLHRPHEIRVNQVLRQRHNAHAFRAVVLVQRVHVGHLRVVGVLRSELLEIHKRAAAPDRLQLVLVANQHNLPHGEQAHVRHEPCEDEAVRH